jgi:putative transposase
VRLPNWDSKYADRLSWSTADKIRKLAAERNFAFHSDDEKHAARAGFSQYLNEEISELPFREQRRLVRDYESEKPRLVDGDIIVKATDEPTPTGEAESEIPVSLPAGEREDDRIPDKAMQRGGSRPRQHVKRGRKRKSSLPSVPSASTPPEAEAHRSVDYTPLEDTPARLAELARDLD